MLLQQNRDWKYFFTIVVAIIAAIVPVWLWLAELQSKSLVVSMVTQTSLEPMEKDTIGSVEISVDGQKLASPQLFVFEIENNGRKPIQASDFDGPLEIRLSTDAKFSRARITGRSPIDLEVDLIVEPQKISFKPTLLNPHDKLVISAITSGATPTLSAKVRVAGVESAPIQKSIRDKSTIPRWLAIPAFFWSAFLLMVALKAMDTFAIGERSDKRRRLTVAAVMIAALPPALAFQFFAVSTVEISSLWGAIGVPVGVVASAWLAATWLSKRI